MYYCRRIRLHAELEERPDTTYEISIRAVLHVLQNGFRKKDYLWLDDKQPSRKKSIQAVVFFIENFWKSRMEAVDVETLRIFFQPQHSRILALSMVPEQ